MSSRWTLTGSPQEIEIEDLLQEVARLKLRLSMIERRKKLEPLDRDFNDARGKYAATTASRSLVSNQFLQTDDDNKGILDDRISSTYEGVFEGPPCQSSTSSLIDSSFKEFKDPWPESSSLPIYDEPVFDVYEDDMFGGVLGVDTPMNNDDKSKPNIHPELFTHYDPKVIEKVEVAPPNSQSHNATEIVETVGKGVTKLKEGGHVLPVFIGDCKECVHCKSEESNMRNLLWINTDKRKFGINELVYYPICHRLQIMWTSLLDRENDTGWKYPDRFSQPNPPP